MRKQLKTIGLLLAVCCMGLAACSQESDGSSAPVATSVNVRYSATYKEQPTLSDHKAEYSFYDEENYYYVFYLGDVTHIPLQDNATVFEYRGNDYSREFTTAETNTQTVSNMVTTAQEKCVEQSFGVKGEADFKGLKKIVDLGISLEYKNSASQTLTQEETYEKAQEYSKERAETVTFAFNSSCKHGYYRYILLGDAEVFGVLVKNKESGEYYTDIYNMLVSQYFSLDYSTVSTFYDNNYGKLKFEMTEEEIAALQTPTLSLEEVKEEEEEKEPEEIVASDAYKTAKVIYDTGNYPIIVTDTEVKSDDFYITELSPYMTNEYILRFEIKLCMREVDAGYQEIYLYNGKGTHVQGINEYAYGGTGFANKTASWITFNWSVNGAQCTERMEMRYAAHAGGADTWVIEDTIITVTVSKA